MKVALLTLGCRVNQSESSVLEGTLKDSGISIVELKDNPDYCIINTCTVTSKSDHNSRQLIRRAVSTGAKVIVTGCYAQLKPDEVKSISGISEIIDTDHKYEIINRITDENRELSFGYYSRSRPYLKVQDGCNFKCSYCSVPLARGRSRSVDSEEIIRRAQIIESSGYNEIVLTGIHLGSYGFDLDDKTNLYNLIRGVLKETRIIRIRLSSLEINEVNDELIELFQETRICKHLHLPLQSGSNHILKLMRRNYSAEKYKKKIDNITRKIDNISIGADVIVGFPGEEEKEFSDTLELIESIPLSYLHVFPFSTRPGTEAYMMKEKPPRRVVKERVDRIIEINKNKKNTYMKQQIDKLFDIIVEEKNSNNIITGTSSNYLKIQAPSDMHERGSIVFVRPMRIINGKLWGIIIK